MVDVNELKGKITAQNMNVEELADKIGCDKSTVYRVFKHPEKMTIGMALKIKTALSMTNAEARKIFLI